MKPITQTTPQTDCPTCAGTGFYTHSKTTKGISICALCNEVNLKSLGDCKIKLRDVATHLRQSAWYISNIARDLESAADVKERKRLCRKKR